jgi:serine/threonine protein kinase
MTQPHAIPPRIENTMSTAHRDLKQGSRLTIENRYEIEVDHPVGTGGMAIVYEGRDLKTRRRVAVKTLRPEYQRDPESRKRFRREARMMAFVSHPNLVTIYDLIDASNGSWMVMEYVEGEDLRSVLDAQGALDPESVMEILDAVGSGLSHMHANNLVHLDVKPQNIIRQPDGAIKLIDFGLAQYASGPQDMIGGTAFGTVAYLAPEQASGGVVTAATDVYALGCVAYELLTGRTPYVAEGPDQKRLLIEAHLNGTPEIPSSVNPDLDLPSWIDDVLELALARDRRDRFQDVDTFVRMFEIGLEDDEIPVPEHRTETFGHAEPPSQRAGILRRRPVTARSAPRREDPWDRYDGISEVQPVQPSVARTLYRRGGKFVRRSGGMRRTLWKLTLLLLVTNLMLGGILLVQDGPQALVERFLSVAPGTTTEVGVENLNLRSAPGAASPLLAVLGNGQQVRVTGLSEEDEQGRWWPVEAAVDGQELQGWVWEGGLQPNTWTGQLSWMQDVVDGVSGGWESVTSGVRRVVDWIPGLWIDVYDITRQAAAPRPVH